MRGFSPALSRLAAAGPLSRTGDRGDLFGMELLGEVLHIFGRGRLEDGLRPWVSYHYYLDLLQAEALMAALAEDFGPGRPADAVAGRFEFTRPGEPLSDYLERRGIAYIYEADDLLGLDEWEDKKG